MPPPPTSTATTPGWWRNWGYRCTRCPGTRPLSRSLNRWIWYSRRHCSRSPRCHEGAHVSLNVPIVQLSREHTVEYPSSLGEDHGRGLHFVKARPVDREYPC